MIITDLDKLRRINMNKKEINEIKRIFSDDCGLFTVNHVVTAFVDSEKNIKCKTCLLYTSPSPRD